VLDEERQGWPDQGSKREARKGSLDLTDQDGTASSTVPSLFTGRKEMARYVVVAFLIVMMAATVLCVGACGVKQVGSLQRQSQSVDVDEARSVRADLRMGAGEFNLTGGADRLMEADFSYNVADWKPEVNYEVSGDTGELSVSKTSLRASQSARPATSGTFALTTKCRPTSTCRWVQEKAIWTWIASP
jgi:hypothetical protein